MKLGFLCRFGSGGRFGFIRGADGRECFCHLSQLRKPVQVGDKIELREVSGDTYDICRGLEDLADQEAPVAFVPAEGKKGPWASEWCLVSTLRGVQDRLVEPNSCYFARLQREIEELRVKVEQGRAAFGKVKAESDEYQRLNPTSIEEALAYGWEVHQDQKKQIVFHIQGPDGKKLTRTFHKAPAAGKVQIHKPQQQRPMLRFRQTG